MEIVVALLISLGVSTLFYFGEGDEIVPSLPDDPDTPDVPDSPDDLDAPVNELDPNNPTATDGNDSVTFGSGDDTFDGGASNDTLIGNTGFDELSGGDGRDEIEGGEGNDLLRCGEGDDIALGGAGSVSVFGGSGSGNGTGNDLIASSDLFNRELDADDYEALRNGDTRDDKNGGPLLADWGLSATDDGDVEDMLSGGYGDDVIILGNSDVARGGDDDLIIGDWIQDGTAAEVTDFATGEDVIVVAVQSEDAVVTTQIVEGKGQVLIDGVVVANISGDFAADDNLDADIITTFNTPLAAPVDKTADDAGEDVQAPVIVPAAKSPSTIL